MPSQTHHHLLVLSNASGAVLCAERPRRLAEAQARRAARPGHRFAWSEADYRAFEEGFHLHLLRHQCQGRMEGRVGAGDALVPAVPAEPQAT